MRKNIGRRPPACMVGMTCHTILSLQQLMEGRFISYGAKRCVVYLEEADTVYAMTLDTFISRDTSERRMAGKTILVHSGMRLRQITGIQHGARIVHHDQSVSEGGESHHRYHQKSHLHLQKIKIVRIWRNASKLKNKVIGRWTSRHFFINS